MNYRKFCLILAGRFIVLLFHLSVYNLIPFFSFHGDHTQTLIFLPSTLAAPVGKSSQVTVNKEGSGWSPESVQGNESCVVQFISTQTLSSDANSKKEQEETESKVPTQMRKKKIQEE